MKFALAASVQGWLFKRADALQRPGLLIAALTLVKPGWLTDLIGLGFCSPENSVHIYGGA